MTDWISFVVASGVVVPWLLAGVCMFTEWICKAMKHCWRMRTDAIYRDVDSQFKADLAEVGLDGRTIRVRSILWWSSVVATACFLSNDMGWLLSMRWLWSMAAPLIVLEIVVILVTAVCLNLATVSYLHGVRARRELAVGRGTDDDGGWDDLLRAAEALSAQYDAIADGDCRGAAALAHRLHTGFGDECGREAVRLVKREHDGP